MENPEIQIKEEANECFSSIIKQEYEEADCEDLGEGNPAMICEPELHEYDFPYESLENAESN